MPGRACHGRAHPHAGHVHPTWDRDRPPQLEVVDASGGQLDASSTADALAVSDMTRVPGARLLLPVGVEGALLSIGDTHAAMGDGEVCGSAVETAMAIAVTVRLNRSSSSPRRSSRSRGASRRASSRTATHQLIDAPNRTVGGFVPQALL